MYSDLFKLGLSSSIYSLTPVIEKSILGILPKDIYLFFKYMIRFLVVLVKNVYEGNIIPSILLNRVHHVKYYLIMAAIIAFSSQSIYLTVLKNNDISYIEPIGNVFINIFSILAGKVFLGETLTKKKFLGLVLGIISILVSS